MGIFAPETSSKTKQWSLAWMPIFIFYFGSGIIGDVHAIARRQGPDCGETSQFSSVAVTMCPISTMSEKMNVENMAHYAYHDLSHLWLWNKWAPQQSIPTSSPIYIYR